MLQIKNLVTRFKVQLDTTVDIESYRQRISGKLL